MITGLTPENIILITNVALGVLTSQAIGLAILSNASTNLTPRVAQARAKQSQQLDRNLEALAPTSLAQPFDKAFGDFAKRRGLKLPTGLREVVQGVTRRNAKAAAAPR